MSDDRLSEEFAASDPTRHLMDHDLDRLLPADKLIEGVYARARGNGGWHFLRRWRRAGVITTSVVLVLSGSAAALALLHSPAKDSTHLTCFTSESLHSSASVVSLNAHPLRTCQTLMHWSRISAAGAPAGALCVLSDGSIGGFPPSRKGNECEALGLVTYDGHVATTRGAEFQRAAQNYFATHQCETLATARVEVTRLLARYGVSTWRIRISGSSVPGSCATFAVQARHKIVDIVGVKF